MAMAVGMLAGAMPVFSQTTLTWLDSATSWDAANAWDGGPWVDNANALFNGTGETVNLGVPNINAGGLTFATGGYTIAPDTDTLTLTGASPTINAEADAVISAVIAGSDGLVKTGAGTLTLTGINTFTGILAIRNGTISVSTLPNAFAASTIGNGTEILLDGGTLQYTGQPYAGNLLRGRTVSIGVNGGTITTSSPNSPVFAGTITNASSDARTLTFGGTGSGGWSGAIAGSLALVKTNSGSWTISGAQKTYTGDTTISAGTLRIGADNVLPTTTTLIIDRDGSLNLYGNYNQTIAVLQDGVNGGGRIHNNYANSTSGTLTIGAGSFSGTIHNGNNLVTLNDRLVGIVKNTDGTLRLSGSANNYAGGTEINGGTLLVNSTATSGTSLGLSNVTVNNNGTLGGIGYVKLGETSAITVASGGTISPGDNEINSGLGTLTLISTKLELLAGSAINFTLGGGNAASALQFWNYTDGNFTFNNVALNFTGAEAGTYDLFKFFSDGGVTAADVGGLNLDGFYFNSSLTDNFTVTWDTNVNGVIALNLAAIPEPSVYFLLVVGGALLLGTRGLPAKRQRA
jgi:autotransporter-associated beta strand protein